MFHITKVSGNAKTGPIPVTTTSRDTCPESCPFKNNGCYAESGPLALHWRKVTEGTRGMGETDFLTAIKALPKSQLWRHNQAGDLPTLDGETISRAFLKALVSANKGKRGFTYTHHRLTPENIDTIAEANLGGFTINISGNNAIQAVKLFKAYKLPTTTVLPVDAPNCQEVDGVKVVACPAEKSDKINCSNCALCAIPNREYVIGFRAHGTGKRKANLIATDREAG